MEYNLPTGWKLTQTCFVCPEQYDLFDSDGENIAYFRLRYGQFYAQVPDVSGKIIYDYSWNDTDPYKGGFDSDEERQEHMTKAIAAVIKEVEEGGWSNEKD